MKKLIMPVNSFYHLKVQQVPDHFNSSTPGLNAEGITGLNKEYGENILTETKQKSKLSIIAAQFNDVK